MKITKKIGLMLTTMAATVLFGCAVSAAPTGIKQTADTTNTVSLDWDDSSVPGMYGYGVMVSTNKDTWNQSTVVIQGSCTESNCSIASLTAGKSYWVTIFEIDESLNIIGSMSTPIEVVTKPSNVAFSGEGGVKQTAAKKNKISVSWPAVAGATGYEVKVSRSNSYLDASVFANTTATSLNINTKSATYVEVACYRKSSTGYIAKSANGTNAYNFSLKPAPGKTKMPKITGENVLGGVNLKYKSVKNCDGYQIQYCKYNGKGKKKVYTSSNEASLSSLNKTTFYKVRVRAFVKLSNGKKVFGKWSKYNAFCMDQTSHSIKASNASTRYSDRVKLSWKKVKGAKNYTLYMSTSENSGYKAVTTTKGTSVTLSSFNGRAFTVYKNYYYYVVANGKVGKKNYKSIKKYRKYFYFYRRY